MGLGPEIQKKPIPDPGSRGQKGTGSRTPDPDPQHWLQALWTIWIQCLEKTKINISGLLCTFKHHQTLSLCRKNHLFACLTPISEVEHNQNMHKLLNMA
jgi:hypothetical protein